MPAPNRRKEARYDAENLLLYPAKDHSLNSKIAFAFTLLKDTSLPTQSCISAPGPSRSEIFCPCTFSIIIFFCPLSLRSRAALLHRRLEQNPAIHLYRRVAYTAPKLSFTFLLLVIVSCKSCTHSNLAPRHIIM